MSLKLFQEPYEENAIEKEEWIRYLPKASVGGDGVIEFFIPGTTNSYIDLKKTRLVVTFRIVKADGTVIVGSKASLENLGIASLFQQCILQLNGQTISPDISTLYPYKAMIDKLVYEEGNVAYEQGDEQFYFFNEGGQNDGISLTQSSRSVQITGPIYTDLAQQDKMIVNGVPITLKLYQHSNGFRLQNSFGETEKHKIEITHISLNVCHATLTSPMFLSHEKTLENNLALYPFWESQIKSFTILSGSESWSIDNCFSGYIPSKIVVGMVNHDAFNGNYADPFRFNSFSNELVEIRVNKSPVPAQPWKYSVEPFVALGEYEYPPKKSSMLHDHTFDDYFALYKFNLDNHLGESVFGPKRKGNLGIDVKFKTALTENITLIIYGKFPNMLKIDGDRNVKV